MARRAPTLPRALHADLNTARFYAGFADPNELAGLVYGLRDGLESGLHPLQARVTCWALLSDGIYSANKRVQRDAAHLLSDDLSVRLLARGTHDGVVFEQLPLNRGGAELAAALMTAIEQEPADPLAGERASVLPRLGMDRERVSNWWAPLMQSVLGSDGESLWLSIGAASGLIRLSAAESERLALATVAAQRAALAAGATPVANSGQGAILLRAVLDGQCCDVSTSSTSHAGNLLRAVRPQHFLSLARDIDSALFPMAVDHYQETVADRRSRSAVFARLARVDARYEKVQRAAAFRRGESGSTAPWQNTAREIAVIHGPCWLASEIAVIGAASQGTRTGGNISRDGMPGGAGLDYGVFVQQVRASRSSLEWWSSHHAAYSDELSRRTWALALLAVADEAVVRASLAALDAVLTSITVDAFRATADSSSRIGASAVGRRLSVSILVAANECRAQTLLLLSHHVAQLNNLDTLAPLPMTTLVDMLAFGPAHWPALRALTPIFAEPDLADLRGFAQGAAGVARVGMHCVGGDSLCAAK